MIRSRLLIPFAAIAFAGCFSASPPTHYYSLTGASSAVHELSAPRHYLAIGPVTVAPYLAQKAIIIRRGEHLLELSEFEQWAEPLEGGIGTALAATISDRLKDAGVLALTADIPRPDSLSVPVSIERFDVGADGTARLVAVWSVVRDDGRAVVPRQRSSFVRTAAGQEPAQAVAALSALVTALGDEISGRLQSHPEIFRNTNS